MPFGGGVPTTELPPGYQLDLDRLPAKSGGCGGPALLILLFMLGIAAAVGFVLWGVSAASRSDEPTLAPPPSATSPLEAVIWPDTATPSPTLDNWSLTGTALYLATITATPSPTATTDYCAFLTPTATATATLIYTPDAWQREGTAVWLTANPPTATPEPRATTPKSWCDLYLTPTATRTRILGTVLPTAEPTSTAAPTRRVIQPAAFYPTSPPPAVVAPPVFDPPATLPPPPSPIVPTVTRVKPDRTATDTATIPPTLAASATPSPTAPVIPATETPQPSPVVVLSSNCEDGYPTFELMPAAGQPVAVAYRLLLERFPVDSGVLVVEYPPRLYGFLNAAGPGRYRLEIDGARVGRVDCLRGPLVPYPVTPEGGANG